MPDVQLPPCGLYRTLQTIAGVPEGQLVYFHNHGDPGPGIYLPSAWKQNRAVFREQGHTLSDLDDVRALEPVAAEGFYRVLEAFHCCDKECRLFDPDTLVQLGYDGRAEPILFSPEIHPTGLVLPDRGTRIDRARVESLSRLRVPIIAAATPTIHNDQILH